MQRRSLVLLALLPLALSQTIQTRVSCLSDGQCITDRGEDAVCGKVHSSSTAKLPLVEGDGEDYVIRIDLSAPLADDPDAPSDKPCTRQTDAVNDSENCEGPNCGCDFDPSSIGRADPRNPILGGVGCETPAFRKACQKCCVQTDILSRLSFVDRVVGRAVRQRCEDDEIGDGEASGLSSSGFTPDCFRKEPLGFYRTPRARFYRRCTELATTVCGSGLRVCRDFSREGAGSMR